VKLFNCLADRMDLPLNHGAKDFVIWGFTDRRMDLPLNQRC